MSLTNVAVVGFGYWGPNLVRNLCELDNCRVKTVCDAQASRLNTVRRRYPSIEATQDWRDLLSDPEIDAIAIATPVSTHYPLAKAALLAGKHVLIEKPMACSSEHCEELIDLGKRQGKIVLVDHTFVYTGAVRKIKELIRSGEMGQIVYFDSVRVNLGLFQHDVDVMWDLAPHDLSIMIHLLEKTPVAVRAVGLTLPELKHTSIAYLAFEFDDAVIGHVHVNWFAPVKIRQTLLAGTRKMIVYDDNDPSEKVKLYDKGIKLATREDIYQTLVQYRMGDMSSPKLDQTEALLTECRHFIDCIQGRCEPESGGELGLQVVRVLEAASESLRSLGQRVEVKGRMLSAGAAA